MPAMAASASSTQRAAEKVSFGSTTETRWCGTRASCAGSGLAVPRSKCRYTACESALTISAPRRSARAMARSDFPAPVGPAMTVSAGWARTRDMGEPYVQEYRARWADMDFNQHMRNAAYLGVAEETRLRFLEDGGFPMAELYRRRLGPVTVEDLLTYKKELRLQERFRVDMAVAAITSDARKIKVRNRFFRNTDGVLCATVETLVLWFDLEERRTVVPPADLGQLWLGLARTEDF